MDLDGLGTRAESSKEERGDSGMKVKMGPVLDDSNVSPDDDALSAEQMIRARDVGLENDDERDLRAELQEYYEAYNRLERQRLRLIFCAQRSVLSTGRSNVDPGTLVMILNLAK